MRHRLKPLPEGRLWEASRKDTDAMVAALRSAYSNTLVRETAVAVLTELADAKERGDLDTGAIADVDAEVMAKKIKNAFKDGTVDNGFDRFVKSLAREVLSKLV